MKTTMKTRYLLITVMILFISAGSIKAESWTDKFKVGADMRLRYEIIDQEESYYRDRFRLRARLKFKGEVTDDFDIIVQLASGSDDPVSTNQTMSGAFSTKGIGIDLAYLDWHPGMVKGLNIYGGKMKNPFYMPGGTELLWDGDLNPEGAAFKFSRSSDVIGFFASAGIFSIVERKEDNEASLGGGQLGLKLKFMKNFHILAGGGYFIYSGIEGFEPVYDDDGFGNEIVDENGIMVFAHNYRNVEGFAEFGGKLGKLPFTVFGDYTVNQGIDDDDDLDDEDDDTAWLIGAQIGSGKKTIFEDPISSWKVKYNYREVQSDAVFGTFTDSDAGGGGTNYKGHEVGGSLTVAKHVTLGVSYYNNILGIGDDDEELDYERWQFDFKLKF